MGHTPQSTPPPRPSLLGWIALACAASLGCAGASTGPGTADAAGAKEAASPTDLGPPAPDAGATLDHAEPGDPSNTGQDPGLPLDPNGVVGRVRDTADNPVVGAKVYVVPASAISKAPLALDTAAPSAVPMGAVVSDPSDEPLEDLIDAQAKSPSFQVTTTDKQGRYHLTAPLATAAFVYVLPEPTDALHLPGGSACRKALPLGTALLGQRLDITVSMTPPADAFYVGSSACVACHGTHNTKATLHALALRRPGLADGLQSPDASKWPQLEAGLALFHGPTRVWFHRVNTTTGTPTWEVLTVAEGEPDPSAEWLAAHQPAFVAELRTSATGEPEIYLQSLLFPSEVAVHAVQLAYGGGLHKQRFVTELGGLRHVLPVQFNHTGTTGNPSSVPASRRRVAPWYPDRWFDATSGHLSTPEAPASFDTACLGCHAPGIQFVKAGPAGAFSAKVVSDPSANLDYDKDGQVDQLNVGCETCHGPGSKHLDHEGNGWFIVSPQRLPPEREAVLCGQCHSRVVGLGAGKAQAPLDSNGRMAVAGTRRATWLAQHVSALADALWTTSDIPGNASVGDGRHSMRHRQQYTDHLKSSHYRNQSQLMACTSCHDPHGTSNEHQLLGKGATATCATCHSGVAASPAAHAKATTGCTGPIGSCASCHMPATVQSGAGSPGAAGFWHGDISSHVLDVPRKGLIAGADPSAPNGPSDRVQPVPYTDACGAACHVLPVPKP